MKLKLTPQRADYTVTFASEGHILTVTVDGVPDTFDLSALGEGDTAVDFVTVLPYNPLITATVVNGELEIAAIQPYGIDADSHAKENREVTL